MSGHGDHFSLAFNDLTMRLYLEPPKHTLQGWYRAGSCLTLS